MQPAAILMAKNQLCNSDTKCVPQTAVVIKAFRTSCEIRGYLLCVKIKTPLLGKPDPCTVIFL